MDEQANVNVQDNVQADAVVAEAASGWLADETGNFTDKWFEKAPAGYRIPDGLKTAKNIWDIIKMADNAQRKLGYPPDALVPKPLPTWKEEQWRDFFAKIGVPQDIKAYQIEPANDDNPEILNEFLQEAQKLGLLPKQVQGVYNFYRQLAEKSKAFMQEDLQRQALEAERTLRAEYGAKFNEKLEQAKRFFDTFCPAEVRETLRSRLGNDPHFIRFLVSAAELVRDDALVAQRTGAATGGQLQALQQELAEIERNPLFYDPREAQKNKREHDRLVQRAYQIRAALSQVG